jgi:hypothetical protein
MLSVTATLTYKDGRPVRVRHVDGRVLWRVEDILPDLELPEVDVTKELPRSRVNVLARDREILSINFLPLQFVPPSGDEITTSSDVVFDPAEIFADRPAPAVSDLLVRLVACGWAAEERLSAGAFRSALPAIGSRHLGDDWVWPYTTKTFHNLSIRKSATPPVVHRRPEFMRRVAAVVPLVREPEQEPFHVRAMATLTAMTYKENWTRQRVSRSVRRRVQTLARRLPFSSSDGDD